MKKFFNYSLAVGTFVAIILFVIYSRDAEFSLAPLFADYGSLIFNGLLNSLYVSMITLVGSLILGFIFYLLSISRFAYFRALVDVFTEVIYGTPLLVMIVLMAFLIGPAFDNFNRPFLGILGLILYISPYMKNVYQSSFSSIPKEQYMAMDLFGFSGWQRYQYIIIPQVIKVLMPPLMNNFSLIVKGSSLMYVLAYAELYYAINIAQSRTFLFVEGYVLLWALYLVITIPLSQLTKWIEKKLQS
ncbi:MAG: Glutamine transport system, permease protein GlnP [Bacillota bacterium]|jgi:polar amino acid transport system permease protein